mgnify:CR=1 FL=1
MLSFRGDPSSVADEGVGIEEDMMGLDRSRAATPVHGFPKNTPPNPAP